MENNIALLSLDNTSFSLLKGKEGIDIRTAFNKALAEAKADKVRESIADIPAKYLKKYGLSLLQLPEVTNVIRMDDMPIYGGLAEDMGIELAKCRHCEHCEDSHCSRYGTIDATDKACYHFYSEYGWWLAAKTPNATDGKLEYIAQFYYSEKGESTVFTDDEVRAIAVSLADSHEGIAFDIANLPAGSKLVIEHV